MKPKISIIIPCYNGEDFLETSIGCAVAQDYENKEIIVVDNESTDNSAEIIKKAKEKYPDIITASAVNLYAHSWQEAVEKGLELMSGDYFTFYAVDDIMMANYISNSLSYMLNNDCEMMQSVIYYFSGVEENGQIKVFNSLGHNYSGIDEFKNRLLNYCCVTTPSVIYKREVLDKYDFTMDSQSYLGASDYELYCSLANQGGYITPSCMFMGYLYRNHPQQNTWGMLSDRERDTKINNSIKLKYISKWT